MILSSLKYDHCTSESVNGPILPLLIQSQWYLHRFYLLHNVSANFSRFLPHWDLQVESCPLLHPQTWDASLLSLLWQTLTIVPVIWIIIICKELKRIKIWKTNTVNNHTFFSSSNTLICPPAWDCITMAPRGTEHSEWGSASKSHTRSP